MTTEQKNQSVLDYVQTHQRADKDDWQLQYALVSTLPEDAIENNWELKILADSMQRSQIKWNESQQPTPKYRPILEVLDLFVAPGHRSATRQELRKRLPYQSEVDQISILQTFLKDCKSDRIWALKFLKKHWNDSLRKAVETSFEQYHDIEAAQVICRWGDTQYIAQHADELSNVYDYYHVRLRLPKDAPIDQSRLHQPWDYITLATHLQIPISVEEAHKALYYTVSNSLSVVPMVYVYASLMSLPGMRHLVWALGQQKQVELLLFISRIHQLTLPLFQERCTDGIPAFIKQELHIIA